MRVLTVISICLLSIPGYSQEGTITVKKNITKYERWGLSGRGYNLNFPVGTKREKEFWVFGRHGEWEHYVNNEKSDTSRSNGPVITKLYSGEWEWENDTLVIYVYEAYKQKIENFIWRYKTWNVNNELRLDRVAIKEKAFQFGYISRSILTGYDIDIIKW